jgi:UDP-N-acetylglucosamine--N-acetylmuramyl-(pentapeptide) pyrophosphoryl-undecaprenol N-acetylglucosamine transferase
LPVVNAGGGMVLADAALTPDLVTQRVAELVTDPPRLAAMTAAAAQVGHRDAARRVARAALDVARHGKTARGPGPPKGPHKGASKRQPKRPSAGESR